MPWQHVVLCKSYAAENAPDYGCVSCVTQHVVVMMMMMMMTITIIIITINMTANGLSPGGSGYYACT